MKKILEVLWYSLTIPITVTLLVLLVSAEANKIFVEYPILFFLSLMGVILFYVAAPIYFFHIKS